MNKMTCAAAAFAMTAAACTDGGEQFEINGRIGEADGRTLYFEAVTLNGIEALDSARLRGDGEFRFRGPRPSNPEFYRLRVERQIVNLSVDSTETIRVEAVLPDMAAGYEVEGSADCQTIKEIDGKLLALQQSVRDIVNDKTLTLGEQQRLVLEKTNLYKDEMKRLYILADPASAPAYFALFQTVNGSLLFNPVSDPDDVKLAGAVATAWDMYYPGTERAANLHNVAIQGMKNTKRPTPISLKDFAGKVSATGFIDIELPDIRGGSRKLSDIRDKVVLLDFTAYSLPSSQERIMQMRSLYEKFSPRGLDIYQVSVDPDEHYWKTACEHLPWTCVYESRGEDSPYLGAYLVTRIPTYFLIDRHGDLVARDEQVEDLEKTIGKLCE